uniref:Transmembrane protein 138 n=1 Tax=Suricata suricatta TaxID=37032 RepID=A0A673U1M9_SURSU
MLQTSNYSLVLSLQFLLLSYDLFVNSFSELLRKAPVIQLVLFIIQDIAILFNIIIIFLMFFNTFVFQAGLVNLLFHKFKGTIVLTAVYFALSISFHVWVMDCPNQESGATSGIFSSPLPQTVLPGLKQDVESVSSPAIWAGGCPYGELLGIGVPWEMARPRVPRALCWVLVTCTRRALLQGASLQLSRSLRANKNQVSDFSCFPSWVRPVLLMHSL